MSVTMHMKGCNKMKKTITIISVSVMVILLLVTLVNSLGLKNQIQGYWCLEDEILLSEILVFDGDTFERGFVSNNQEPIKGTFEIKDKSIILTEPRGEYITSETVMKNVSVRGNILYVYKGMDNNMEEHYYTYKRISKSEYEEFIK